MYVLIGNNRKGKKNALLSRKQSKETKACNISRGTAWGLRASYVAGTKSGDI